LAVKGKQRTKLITGQLYRLVDAKKKNREGVPLDHIRTRCERQKSRAHQGNARGLGVRMWACAWKNGQAGKG